MEDRETFEASVKKKHINKKLILIIIIDILFVIGAVFIAIKLWPSKEKTDKNEIDSLFSSLNIPKELLENISKTCDISGISTSFKLDCGAKLLTINGYLAEAKNFCEKMEDSTETFFLKTRCLAFIVAQTNQSEGIKMCNEINYSSIPRNICILRILYYSGHDPFEFCNKINDNDEKYGCTAILFGVQSNWNETFKSCDNIKNTDEKNICVKLIRLLSSRPSN